MLGRRDVQPHGVSAADVSADRGLVERQASLADGHPGCRRHRAGRAGDGGGVFGTAAITRTAELTLPLKLLMKASLNVAARLPLVPPDTLAMDNPIMVGVVPNSKLDADTPLLKGCRGSQGRRQAPYTSPSASPCASPLWWASQEWGRASSSYKR